MTDLELFQKIRHCAFTVRSILSKGYLEIIYRKAMVLELKDAGLSVAEEKPLVVYYKGNILGNYKADIIVEDRVIIELKAQSTLTIADSQQLVNYLSTTGIPYGVLINFGSDFIQFYPKSVEYPQPQWMSKI